MKKLTGVTLIATSTLALAACTHNPQTAHLPAYQQCISLQHKMMYIDNFRNEHNSAWENQAKTQRLGTQFRKMNCDHILVEARQGQPKK